MTTRKAAGFWASNQPVSETIAAAASAWLTELMSGDMTAQDRQRWLDWRAQHPDHERAWAHIEAVLQRLGGLNRSAAAQSFATLDKRAATRRTVLRAALGLGAAAGIGGYAYRCGPGQYWAADFRTGVGEHRQIVLADDTRIMLNTDTAIDVAFDDARRVVRLVSGEIQVITGHAPLRGAATDPRPFSVESRDGGVRALGTRFIVRQFAQATSVAVLESATEVVPAADPDKRVRIQAGQRATFTRDRVEAPAPLTMSDSAWTQGQIVAENTTLGTFVDELSRFRKGWIRCDPRVASLRFSGVFPVTDPDQILALLPNTLPIRVRRYTPYWVTIGPREQAGG